MDPKKKKKMEEELKKKQAEEKKEGKKEKSKKESGPPPKLTGKIDSMGFLVLQDAMMNNPRDQHLSMGISDGSSPFMEQKKFVQSKPFRSSSNVEEEPSHYRQGSIG